MTGASLDALNASAMVLAVRDHTNRVCLGDTGLEISSAGCRAYPLFAVVMACHLHRLNPLDRHLQSIVVFAPISRLVFVVVFDGMALN